MASKHSAKENQSKTADKQTTFHGTVTILTSKPPQQLETGTDKFNFFLYDFYYKSGTNKFFDGIYIPKMQHKKHGKKAHHDGPFQIPSLHENK
jgi:hypothetical protein